MSVYQWKRPPGTVEARQINSSEDLDAFIGSLTESELVGSWASFSQLENLGVADGMFHFRVWVTNPDWEGRWDVVEPLGTWLTANRDDANISYESAESFESRFEPFEP